MTQPTRRLFYGWWIVGASFLVLLITVGIGLVMISATLGAAAGPVVTGRIFDVTGGYTLAFILHIVSFTLAAVVFYCVRRPDAAAAGRR
jgi:hypothetical protein